MFEVLLVCVCLMWSMCFACDLSYGAVWCVLFLCCVVFVFFFLKAFACFVCDVLCGGVWPVVCVVLCLCAPCIFLCGLCDIWCDVILCVWRVFVSCYVCVCVFILCMCVCALSVESVCACLCFSV